MRKFIDNLKKEIKKKKIPLGVQVVAGFYILSTILNLIYSILFFIGSLLFLTSKTSHTSGEAFSFYLGTGIWYLVMAAISITILFWIWNGKKWARYLVIFFALSSILLIIFYFPKSILQIISLIINAGIFFYLILSKKAKEYFKK